MGETVERVLSRLQSPVENGSGYMAFCPAHDDGAERALSITEAEDGKVLLRCFAGCDAGDVVAAVGLEIKDLFPDNGKGGGGWSTPADNGATVQRSPQNPHGNGEPTVAEGDATVVNGATLSDYAAKVALPESYLKKLGLSDFKYSGRDVVRIPYHTANGSEAAVRFRLALEKSGEGPDGRFRWRKGDKTHPYGLFKIEAIKRAGWCVLVEGESDTQTLLYHRIPALGIPGVSNWKSEWASYLEEVDKVFVVVEPDEAGEGLWKRLASSELAEKLYRVELPGAKDVSELHVADPENFGETFNEALRNATAWLDIAESEAAEAQREAWAECEDLARCDDILSRFAADLAASGVAGEGRVAKLLYLALTSRLLDKPISVAVKGPSSGGKSYLVDRVLSYFPDNAYYSLTAMSEHALAYSEEPLSHRHLVIYEAAGMESDFQSYLMRSLLSEGRIRYELVEKTSEGMRPRLIEREGPTGLIVTTTKTRMHPENETRMLSLTVTDSAAQTASVMAALAKEASGSADLTPYQALQRWLATSERRVAIPYASDLAAAVPPLAVRLRRDFGALLNLIKAHALLHQANRERNAEGSIIATVGDYAVVRELVEDLVSEGIEATVPPSVREVVETVATIHAGSSKPVTVAEIAGRLALDKSAASRRVRSATERGYLVNLEDKRGKPARLVPGEDLPEERQILPDPETVAPMQTVANPLCNTATVTDREDTGSVDNRCSDAPVQRGEEHPPPPADDGGRGELIQKLVNEWGYTEEEARAEVGGEE